ncbi:hypothetical protein V1264_014954 [Littorina saxatilis]|uniref:Uncharacterized protein n=1 Tax=Littorina saxatilis TaxID=31220 RepID=A0AAN9BK47_9CAEN
MGSLQLAVIFGCLSVVCATSMARLEPDLKTYPSFHHDDLEPSTGDEFDDDGWAIPAGEDLDEYSTDYPEDYDYSTEEPENDDYSTEEPESYDYSTEEPESYDYSTEEPESYESTTEVSESFNSMDEDHDSRVFGMDKNTVKEDGEGEMDEGDLGIDSVVDGRRNRTEAMLQLINETYVLMQDLPPPDVDNSTCHWKNRTAFVKKFAFRVMAIIETRGSHKHWDPSHHHKHHRGPSHHRSRGPNKEFPLPHLLPSSPTDGRIPAQMSAGVPDRRPRPLPSAESEGFMGNNGGGRGMGPTPGKPPSSSSTGNAMIGQVMGSIFGKKNPTTSNQKPAGGRWGGWRNMEKEQKQGGGPGKGSGGQWKAGETQPAEGGKQGGPGQRWGGKGAGGGWGGNRGGGGEGGRGGGRGGGEGGEGEGGALGPHVNHSRQPGAGTQTDNNTGSSNSMSFPNPFRRPQSPSSSMGMGLGGGSGAPSPPGSPGAGMGGANLGNALLGLMENLGKVGKGAGAGTGSANIMSLLSLLNRRR